MDLGQPRISANELGNFVFSNDSARRRILRGQKFPKAGIVARYQRASAAILRSLESNVFSETLLRAELEKLEKQSVTTKWQASTRDTNIRMVRRFIPLAEKASPPEGEHTIIRRNADFEFEGVRISVRPDILTRNVNDKFFTYSKLRFSNQKYSADASEIVLLLIQKFAEGQEFEELDFDTSRARLIDCNSQQIFEAHDVSPYKGQLLMKALKEIRGFWPFIAEN
jgi:hypothetical protein